MARMKAAKPAIMERHMQLLAERYDLGDRPAPGVTMSGGKPVQQGVRVRLPEGTTREKLAAISPGEIRAQKLWPKGGRPLERADDLWYCDNPRCPSRAPAPR